LFLLLADGFTLQEINNNNKNKHVLFSYGLNDSGGCTGVRRLTRGLATLPKVSSTL